MCFRLSVRVAFSLSSRTRESSLVAGVSSLFLPLPRHLSPSELDLSSLFSLFTCRGGDVCVRVLLVLCCATVVYDTGNITSRCWFLLSLIDRLPPASHWSCGVFRCFGDCSSIRHLWNSHTVPSSLYSIEFRHVALPSPSLHHDSGPDDAVLLSDPQVLDAAAREFEARVQPHNRKEATFLRAAGGVFLLLSFSCEFLLLDLFLQCACRWDLLSSL